MAVIRERSRETTARRGPPPVLAVLDLGSKLLVGFKPEIYAKEVTLSGRARNS